MSSYGKIETEKLKQNVENQLDRLMEQLGDLESCRDSMESSEYEETKEETMEQLKELNASLSKLVNGNISLVSSIGAIQMATQAAISEAFKTPEVIRLFGRREPKQLRERLEKLDEDLKHNKLSQEVGDRQKCEILVALRQLNEKLSIEELQFLQQNSSEFGILNNTEFLELKSFD